MHPSNNANLYLSLIERTSGIGSWRWDLTENTLHWSDQSYRIHGLKQDAYTPTLESALAFIHPDDQGTVRKALNGSVQGKNEFELKFRIIRADGQVRQIASKGECLLNEQGDVVALLGIFQDITERPELSQPLLANKEHFGLASFYDLSVDLICISEHDRFILVNPAFEKILGFSRDELLSRPFNEFIHPEDLAATNEEISMISAGRITRNFENRYRHKNGGYVWINWSAQIDEKANLIYAIGRNVTIEKERERLLRKYNAVLKVRNKELDEFAYVASHDLKAPLRAIDSLATWIEEDAAKQLSEVSRNHLAKLKQRISRMERLLEDLLHYSRAGRVNEDIEEVDCNELIQAIITFLNPLSSAEVRVPTELPILQTQRLPLYQIFLNLISNAIKHNDKEYAIVTISWKYKGEMVAFTISDNGPGISEAFHERIFQIFQTLKPRDKVEGSGIGLAIVQKLVHNFGGTISVLSGQEPGTSFQFTWPRNSTSAKSSIITE